MSADISPQLPSDPKEFKPFFKEEPLRIVRNLASALKGDPPRRPSRPLTSTEQTQLHNILQACSSVAITPSAEKQLSLKGILGIVTGTVPNTRWEFPEPERALATTIFADFSAQNWGAPPPPLPTPSSASSASSPSPGPDPPSAMPTMSAPPLSPRARAPPPPHHPIYGARGIMRGVLWHRNPRRVSYSLDPRFPRPSAKRYGHNGIPVGAWWPSQLCALRDGAHGHAQAGIAGSAEGEGAYSVVIAGSGAYRDLDRDFGDTVHYSGVVGGGVGTRALRQNLETGKPVRVLRSSAGEWRGRPSVGVRYDGLYRVVEEKVVRGEGEERYARFLLEREGGQREIERGRPSGRERRDFERVVEGY
ncbi:MAG: hypothetical protein LQ342_002484 [Letrouitia transgressa]|nr:MAG: hypothetical protein LQ342_002484 [Letrouitia transgressa]